ncbi:hypothetical protein WAF17_14215 [Bernardetia sp. ABR2-2B]|uniref:hypothetical protein n=1 Tax=Bernardetia sp. ABR2-2B TaxID=3127472 RepID=UPI0030D2E8C6
MKIISAFYIIALLSIVLSFSACNTKTTYETIKTDQKYSLDLPTYLQPANDLNDDATLQYQNLIKEFYVVVIEDSKEDYNQMLEMSDTTGTNSNKFESFSKLFSDSYEQNLNLTIDKNPTDFKIGSLSAKTFSMTGTLEESEIYYHFTLIDGKDTYYQVLQWTLAGRKESYKGEMDKIIKSFKEL